MPKHSVTTESVRECLIGEHFAPAQQMPIQVYNAIEPSDGDIIGDWEVKGYFYNDQHYCGPLSGLGIRLEPGVISGLVNLKALPGYKPLMPGAYRALKAIKANTSTEEQGIKLWTRVIGFALDRDGSMVPHEAGNAWLEEVLEGYHCRYVVEVDAAEAD